MFSNLIRQQARLALSARLATPIHRQSAKPFYALPSAQTSQLLSQRTFSISRSLFEETPTAPAANTIATETEVKVEDPGKTLYISNVPWNLTEEELADALAPYGKLNGLRLNPNGAKGIAFAEFASQESATAVLESSEEEPFVLMNRPLTIRYARSWASRTTGEAPKKQVGEPTSTIHIANWPTPGDEQSLRSLLKDFENDILRVHFMKDFQGKLTRKAFVQFHETDTATIAFKALEEKSVEGTNLQVYYAKQRSRASRPSGGRAYDA
ncbi:hypothetical protein P691DRAFT_415605 [Macrolepiota fuliginosa MF-IS2]|uniref:RRM domain-containing protein n=1 Tax=Macrolepiota fuliginosa MF-IS2 TaxID=1400762 RepID=A0A9P5XHF5_9AGAR|nr:hypothetical protein P691DRAFT_415605 [Macrolepiota fuliginosa MF-IS2]